MTDLPTVEIRYREVQVYTEIMSEFPSPYFLRKTLIPIHITLSTGIECRSYLKFVQRSNTGAFLEYGYQIDYLPRDMEPLRNKLSSDWDKGCELMASLGLFGTQAFDLDHGIHF